MTKFTFSYLKPKSAGVSEKKACDSFTGMLP